MITIGLLSLFCLSCSRDSDSPSKKAAASDVAIHIMAGSESKLIEPIIMACARKNGIQVKMHYSGSVDMMLALKKEGFPYDAVLPASSTWLRLAIRNFAVSK